MTTKDARIRFATDILRRLGEELNPSPERGIIELVKNAYDADALNCTVELLDVDRPGGRVRITDDGLGMTPADITEGWLVLGKSRKSLENRTDRGRTPAGSKGLGRLAALRLGTKAELTTFPASNENAQLHLLIDWDQYENVDTVDDVALQIEEGIEDSEQRTAGTVLDLSNLHNAIGRSSVKRLAREMILLADPFQIDPEGFRPQLVVPEYKDLEDLVSRRYFEEADYHLIADVDDSGNSSARVVDSRGQILLEASHDELAGKRKGHEQNQAHDNFECPKVRFELWAFKLSAETFQSRHTTVGEVKKWLAEFGGVHVYWNGLRVSPYGDEGGDWLDMNLARVRNPEERPSTNNSIGRVQLEDNSGKLEQKTDRSGFIEGDSFRELRRFAQAALEWMAKRRLEVAELRRRAQKKDTKTKTAKAQKSVKKAMASIESDEGRKNVEEAFHKYEKSRDREVRDLQREVQLYRTLSTAGITAATFAHESGGNPIKVIDQSILAIERRTKSVLAKEYFEEKLASPIGNTKRSVKSLGVLGSATLRLVEHGKRRPGRVELHKTITSILSTFSPFLEGRGVQISRRLCSGQPFLRASEAAIESVITNLLNNSLTAFENSDRNERIIDIETSASDGLWVLRLADSGPGIKDIPLRDIWLPGETTRSNGTGLGLTILRDTVVDLGGSVQATARCEKLGGAVFEVTLPILGF